MREFEPEGALAFTIYAASQASIAFLQHGLNNAALLKAFKRPRLDANRSRGRCRLGCLLDDAEWDSQAGQLQCCSHPGRTCSDDKNPGLLSIHDKSTALSYGWHMVLNLILWMPALATGSPVSQNLQGRCHVWSSKREETKPSPITNEKKATRRPDRRIAGHRGRGLHSRGVRRGQH